MQCGRCHSACGVTRATVKFAVRQQEFLNSVRPARLAKTLQFMHSDLREANAILKLNWSTPRLLTLFQAPYSLPGLAGSKRPCALPYASHTTHCTHAIFRFNVTVLRVVRLPSMVYVVYIKHGGGFGRPLQSDLGVVVTRFTSFAPNDCLQGLAFSFDDRASHFECLKA